MQYENKLIEQSIDCRSNIIELSENDIVKIDSFIAGIIFIKRNQGWKKKFFVISDQVFEYWSSNKETKKGRKRVKEKFFEFDHNIELSCLKKKVFKNKLAWSFNVYKNNKRMISCLSFNQKMEDIHEKMKNSIYYLN